MTLPTKTFSDMNRDSLSYLTKNTDVTYLAQGSIARALIEATNLEISQLQDFVNLQSQNSFLSTAGGLYLDLFGELLGIPRNLETKAAVGAQDQSVRFYVRDGVLRTRLPDPSDPSKGLVPAGTTITNPEGTVSFTVPIPVKFPANTKSVYVPVISDVVGKDFNVGVNQLTRHTLGTDLLVTNDTPIATGADIESDEEYRFRLSRAMTARFNTNETAVELAALSQPGVVSVDLLEYARGAGTFDVLLVPKGNRLTQSTKDAVRRSVEQSAAFGVSARVREPEYLPFKITVSLTFKRNTPSGIRATVLNRVQTAILSYFGNIPMGGEIIINQIRANVINTDDAIQDMRIIELCLDGSPRSLRNYSLRPDELVVPDNSVPDPVQVV